MKVAVIILSILVLAVASESIEENSEDFAVEESERGCGDINAACESDCDCCGTMTTCDCYWGPKCKCRDGGILTAGRKLFCKNRK